MAEGTYVFFEDREGESLWEWGGTTTVPRIGERVILDGLPFRVHQVEYEQDERRDIIARVRCVKARRT